MYIHSTLCEGEKEARNKYHRYSGSTLRYSTKIKRFLRSGNDGVSFSAHDSQMPSSSSRCGRSQMQIKASFSRTLSGLEL